MVRHGAVGKIGDGVAKRGELPVQNCQHLALVTGVQDQVVQPAYSTNFWFSSYARLVMGWELLAKS